MRRRLREATTYWGGGVGSSDSTVAALADGSRCLDPAEDFFDAFTYPLAGSVYRIEEGSHWIAIT